MDLGACVLLTFLALAIAIMFYHLRAVVDEQRRLAREQQELRMGIASTSIKADAAVHTAQRAEEKAITAQAASTRERDA